MMMTSDIDPNADEIAYWNGPGGLRWLQRQQKQEALLAPVAQVLFDRAQARPGEHALDIGCGCGGTSIALARRVAPDGSVLGVDVSAPMVQRAREVAALAENAPLRLTFALGDATTYEFEAVRADLLFSRFGVMFFADPGRSFRNLRRGLRPGARMVFACWRAPRENPWLMLPYQEATKHVPRLPDLGPEAPGPFSFADARRVRAILEDAGFSDVALEPVDLLLDLANGQGLQAALDTALEMGPASRVLDGQPQHLREAASAAVSAALLKYQQGNGVPLPGAIWLVTASSA